MVENAQGGGIQCEYFVSSCHAARAQYEMRRRLGGGFQQSTWIHPNASVHIMHASSTQNGYTSQYGGGVRAAYSGYPGNMRMYTRVEERIRMQMPHFVCVYQALRTQV